MLPTLELSCGDLRFQPKPAEQRRKCARLALEGLLERLNLEHRGILWILGRDVEVTRIGAHSAVHTRLQAQRAQRTELSGETPHGACNPLPLSDPGLFRRQVGAQLDR